MYHQCLQSGAKVTMMPVARPCGATPRVRSSAPWRSLGPPVRLASPHCRWSHRRTCAHSAALCALLRRAVETPGALKIVPQLALGEGGGAQLR